MVLDYDYAGPNSAALFGLTVAPSGTIYSAGTGGDTNGDWHGIVLASGDHGSTWWNVLDDASPDWYTDFSGGIAADAFGNVYVAGMLSDTNSVQSDRWIVRRSADGGVTWTAADSFAMGTVGAIPSSPTAITTDAAGNVYVVGRSRASGQIVWTVRKGVGGTSFSTVDQGPIASFGRPQAVFAHPTAGIFVAGATRVTVKNVTSDVWLVRRSTDGGATWSNVDNFQLSSSRAASAMGIGADASGNLYVVGSGNGPSNISHWIVRKSTNGGTSWTTVDDYQLDSTRNSQANCIATDANHNLWVAGYGRQADGSQKWIVRKSAGGTGPWTPVDVFQGSNFNIRIAIAADPFGNVFAGGDGVQNWLIKKY